MKKRLKRKYWNNRLLDISKLPRTINCFCLAFTLQHELLFYKCLDFYSNIDPHELADEFVDFFELKYPLTLKQLLEICKRSNIHYDFHKGEHNVRGYNYSYGKKTGISLRKNDSPSGNIHTCLHELYEIIDQRFFVIGSTYGKKFVDTPLHQRADRFAACAHVPSLQIRMWIDRHGLDIFGLEKHCNSSYASALIRLNEELQYFRVFNNKVEPLAMIGLLYERRYWKKTSGGRLPNMKLTCFTNSDEVTFDLKIEDMAKVGFFNRNTKTAFEMNRFIKLFAREGLASFFPNLIMYTRDSLDGKLKPMTHVDLLVRVVAWNKYHYPMKLLIQIMPSHMPYLARVADSLKIESYDKIMAEKERILNACRTLRKGVVRKTG